MPTTLPIVHDQYPSGTSAPHILHHTKMLKHTHTRLHKYIIRAITPSSPVNDAIAKHRGRDKADGRLPFRQSFGVRHSLGLNLNTQELSPYPTKNRTKLIEHARAFPAINITKAEQHTRCFRTQKPTHTAAAAQRNLKCIFMLHDWLAAALASFIIISYSATPRSHSVRVRLSVHTLLFVQHTNRRT